jgi:hypothetical protein
MNLQEIKDAVDAGKTVHWTNAGYKVILDNLGRYLIESEFSGSKSWIGLTWTDGVTLNGMEEDFFCAMQSREYAFDVTLNACVRVTAASEAQAREMMNEHLDCMNGSGRLGVFPATGQAGVIVTEASLATEPDECSLFMVDDCELCAAGDA